MSDPFQDVDAGGPAFVELLVDGLEKRAAEEQMQPIINAYLDDIEWVADGRHIEVGTGSGPIARAMASRMVEASNGPQSGHATQHHGQIIGIDPSPGLIDAARRLARETMPRLSSSNADGTAPGLQFETGDGAGLRFENASLDTVVMHTVLSHVAEPAALLAEAYRTLKPGGRLVVCDADFSKLSFGSDAGDPLDACAKYFSAYFVSQPHIVAGMRQLATTAGFTIEQFRIINRVVTAGDGNLVTVVMTGNRMVDSGLVGRPLADALVAEYARRRDAGLLYALTPFGTLVARK